MVNPFITLKWTTCLLFSLISLICLKRFKITCPSLLLVRTLSRRLLVGGVLGYPLPYFVDNGQARCAKNAASLAKLQSSCNNYRMASIQRYKRQIRIIYRKLLQRNFHVFLQALIAIHVYLIKGTVVFTNLLKQCDLFIRYQFEG